MTRLRLAPLVLAPLVLAGPARADDFTVRLEMRESAGPLATNTCIATAETAAPGYVPLTTAVQCSVDDTTFPASAPGPKAVAVVAAQAGPTVLFCVGGAATFVNAAGDRVDVTAPEQCMVLDH